MGSDPPALGSLCAQLAGWLPQQRWFQGKDRTVRAVSPLDAATLSDRLMLTVVEVDYTDGERDHYLVPLSPRRDGALLLGDARVDDALRDEEAVRLLARRTCSDDTTETAAGDRLRGRPITAQEPGPAARVRPLGVEQSNSSVVLDDRWILKVLRRLEAGVHPDVELTAALTRAGFPHVPAQHGSLELAGDGEPTALAVLSEFLGDGEEGWAVATGQRPQALLAELPGLGRAIADLHRTLASELGAWEPDTDQTGRWAETMVAQLDRVLATAGRHAPESTATVRERAPQLRAALARTAELVDVGRLVRIHGDLHLGQVLLASDRRWLLLDFEGEPIKPLARRRAPDSPLRDVAGMLRSFDYAAASARDGGGGPESARWRDAARTRFLDGYLERAAALLPADWVRLLAALELDKAVYELGYEIANRPDWVGIPAEGILRLLDTIESGEAKT